MKTMIRALSCQALAGLAFLGATAVADASAFIVSPVRVTLSAKQTVAAITVTNTGTEPAVVQLETMQWSQAEGQEILDLSTAVLATPPIFTVPAGKSQIVRVGLRRAPDVKRELTYRLILREVPPEDQSAGLHIALKISMPIFIAPAGANAAPLVQWRARRTADGNIRVVAYNTGTAHVQFGQLDIVQAGNGKPIATHPTADYVLPDNSRTWTVSPKSALPVGTMLHVSSQTDAGKVESDVALENDGVDTAPPTASR
jgi:fimbrial chaperone protein